MGSVPPRQGACRSRVVQLETKSLCALYEIVSNHSYNNSRGNPRRRHKRRRDNQTTEKNESSSLTGPGAFVLLLLIIAGWSYIEPLLVFIFCLLLASPLIALFYGLYWWYRQPQKSNTPVHLDAREGEENIVQFPRRR
jgi:hypothetical protein